MTIHYIDENASGADNGTSWTDAFRDSKTANDSASTVTGDTYWYASDHDYAYADIGNLQLIFPDNCTLISVNKTNDEYLAGAKETVGFTDDLLIVPTNYSANLNIDGVSFDCDDKFNINKRESNIYFSNLTLGLTSAASVYLLLTSDGQYISFKNTIFSLNTSGQFIYIYSGGRVDIDGGSLLGATTELFRTQAGGMQLSVKNFDASAMISGAFINTFTLDDDRVSVEFSRVKKNANVSIYVGDIPSASQTIDAWSIDNGSGYHYFESHSKCGKVVENTTVMRGAWYHGDTYHTDYGFSAKFTPNSNTVEFTKPLSFRLKTLKLDLSSADVVLRVHILLDDSAEVPTSLRANNCRIKVVYPDAIDTALGKTVYSNPTVNILTTATDLPTETVTFTGHSGTNQKQHYLDVTIPQNTATGMDEAVCELWLEVSKDLSTGTTEMFVCPEPTVS